MKVIKKKVLIIADSMAMPREDVKYEETWVYNLVETFQHIHFIDRSRRGTTTNRLVQEGGGYKNVKNGADLLEYYKPDLVIIQLGLVDCSPRLLNVNAISTKIVNHLPIRIKMLYYNYLKKHNVRQPKYAYVSIEKFYSNYLTFIQRAQTIGTKVIAISIAPVSESFVMKSPYIQESIKKYNLLLSSLEIYDNFKLIDPFTKPVSHSIFVDEMHFNSDGHNLVYNIIKKELCQI